MSRIGTIEPGNASEKVAELYTAVKAKLGVLPNMVKALGNSEAALQAYLGISGAVSGGTIPAGTREKIALLTAEANACDYCLRAHTAIGGMLKLSPEELQAARRGGSSDAREQALLDLAQAVIDTRGDVPDAVHAAAKAAGVTDAEAAEVVANVAVNVFTNYFNRFAQTEIDFPEIEAPEPACATCH